MANFHAIVNLVCIVQRGVNYSRFYVNETK
jgi:hypothetical protein